MFSQVPVTCVRVPGSSANLGPGFDCLGLALALHSTFEVETLCGVIPSGPRIEIAATSAGDSAALLLPTDHRNLFYQAFATHLETLGSPVPAVRIRMRLGVPTGRGLGSSAAAVVGGILAAEASAGRFPDSPERRAQLLPYAARLELGQHSDNVAAALLGGLAVTSRDEQSGEVRSVHLPVPSGLRAVLFIPDLLMDTVAGRALLPTSYSRADAVHNLGHTALLVAALAGGDLGLLAAAMDDRLHEPYRAELFPQLPALLAAARAAGAPGVCLSGGGSTILALCENQAQAVADALRQAAEALHVNGRVEIVEIDRRGARVTRRRAGAARSLPVPAHSPGLSLHCRECGADFPVTYSSYRCPCGRPLDLQVPAEAAAAGASWRRRFDQRLGSLDRLDRSGVWRFRDLLLPLAGITPVSRPEGQTNCYPVGREQGAAGHGRVGAYAGLDHLWLKHEGENPTGSFKDRGMTVAVTIATWLGATAVACASTGNTSASMAAYAAQAGLPAIVLLPEGKVSSGKLSQAIAYGAEIRTIPGDFDQAMAQVEDLAATGGIYLLNSLNPFRLIGQQSLALELLQQLRWDAPDWIALPAGNLGNTSALGMGLQLAFRVGLIARVPRIAAIQAAGANPFYQSYRSRFRTFEPVRASTIATAINIGNPVSYLRAAEAIRATRGVVAQVSDQEILQAKAVVDRVGLGCEPASAAAVAGLRRLVQEGTIRSDARVVAVLTGNLLKDPAAIAAGERG